MRLELVQGLVTAKSWAQRAIYKALEAPVRVVQDRLRPTSLFPYTFPQLSALPLGSVGRALADWLVDHHLDLIGKYENHDMQHLLLGYGPDVQGEYCLHAFMWGNGHRTFLTAATLAVGYATMPEAWGHFRRATQRGRATPGRIDLLDFNALPTQPIETVHRTIGLQPIL